MAVVIRCCSTDFVSLNAIALYFVKDKCFNEKSSGHFTEKVEGLWGILDKWL